MDRFYDSLLSHDVGLIMVLTLAGIVIYASIVFVYLTKDELNVSKDVD